MTDASVEPLGETCGRTSTGLLAGVKARDQEAWRRFVELYGPLVDRWCRRFGLQGADLEDVRQDVFRTVAETVDGFRHDRKGDSFRGWLCTITRTRAIDCLRRRAREAHGVGGTDAQERMLAVLDDTADTKSEDEQDGLFLLRRAAEMVLERSSEETRQVFSRVVIGGERPADVALDLGMSTNAVYLAKSRILQKIREDLAHLVDI
jgi:RNA polymerase sigma-70 factor (ECF subfamily)